MSKDANLHRVLSSGVVAIMRAPSGGETGRRSRGPGCRGRRGDRGHFHRTRRSSSDRAGGRPPGRPDRDGSGRHRFWTPRPPGWPCWPGQSFIVAPTVSVDVIRMCRRYDKLVMPGAMTPTEVLAAWEAGADLVKVFPSDYFGPGYLKVLHGPLPQVRLMPTGGRHARDGRRLHPLGCRRPGDRRRVG